MLGDSRNTKVILPVNSFSKPHWFRNKDLNFDETVLFHQKQNNRNKAVKGPMSPDSPLIQKWNITEMEVLISKFMASPEPIPPYGVPEGGIQLRLTLLIHVTTL